MASEINNWLNQQPPEEYIEIIDGVSVIRQKVVERLLDELTECNWETQKFKLTRFFDHDGKEWVDASILLVVHYENITRKLTGAVTYDVARFGQLHSSNTAKSLCIVNAASELGNRFGRNLNPSVEPVIAGVRSKKKAVKFTATPEIIKSYKSAIFTGNDKVAASLLEIYNIPDA